MDVTPAEALAVLNRLVDELFPRTTLTRRHAIQLEVSRSHEIEGGTSIWRAPGWDAALAEARDGDNSWDADAQSKTYFTTALIAGLTERQLRAVLAHELAHIEAGDHLHNWVSGDEMRQMEQRADERGVEICGDAPALACGLLRVFRDLAPETDEHAATHGSVHHRVSRIGVRMAADLEL